MKPFQTKDDHLTAWANAYARLKQITEDYRNDEIGYVRYRRELDEVMADMRDMCNLSLSDPDYAEPKPF